MKMMKGDMWGVLQRSQYKLRDILVSYYNITEGAEPYLSVINSINALIDQYNLVITQREADAAKTKKVVNG